MASAFHEALQILSVLFRGSPIPAVLVSHPHSQPGVRGEGVYFGFKKDIYMSDRCQS